MRDNDNMRVARPVQSPNLGAARITAGRALIEGHMTRAELLKAWNSVKGRHSGPYGELTAAEQAGVVLATLGYAGALKHLRAMSGPERGDYGYWTAALNALEGARA